MEAGRLQDGPKFTWDPENYLNQIGPHAHCPGQRCDHVLLPGTAAAPTTGDGAVIEIGAYSSQTSPLSPYSAQPTPTGGEVMATWEVESVRVMFEEQIADIGDGKMSTLSDHHGLLVKLRKKA